MARTRCLFSAASVLGIAGLTAAQTTLHVSPAGDDRRGTGAPLAPLQSIDVALTRSAAVTDGGSTMARFADLDRDGDQDLLVTQGNRLGWYENVGTRTAPRLLPPRWVPGAVFPSEGEPLEAHPADFQFDVDDGDGDARLDLFVTRSDGRLWFLRQLPQSPLRFAPPLAIPLPGVVHATSGVILADINGDGRRDVVLASLRSSNDLYWMQRVSEGNPPPFGAPVYLLPGVGKNPAISTADMDGDGRRDLVMWPRMQAAATRVLGYFVNTGTNLTPVFQGPLITALMAAWVTEADLDGDGTDEFHAAVVAADRTRFDMLRLPRDSAGRPDLSRAVPLRFDPTAPPPQRVVVEVPPDDFSYVTAFPLTVSGSTELVASLPAPGSSVPRVTLSRLGAMPGSRLLHATAPRLGAGMAMVVLEGTSPRLVGFELLCHDASFGTGVLANAISSQIERVAARGFTTGFVSQAGRPLLSQCAASGCATGAVLQKGGTVRSCTFAGNGDGLALGTAPGQPASLITESILSSNAGVDLGGFASAEVHDSFVGTIGALVTVAARQLRRDDPGLRDPHRGDLRLAALSSAIGWGTVSAAVDLDGNPRRVGARADLGACEWSPVALRLQVRDAGRGLLDVQVRQPAGALALMMAGTPAATPLSTPFGDLLLGRWWLLPVQAGQVQLGGTGALTGTRVLFQAFVLDPAAGEGWPTNVVEWAVR